MVSDPDEAPLPRGWYAYLPEGVKATASSEPSPRLREGAVLKLMAEDDVDVPLWVVGGLDSGLVFDDVADFIAFGASPELANDLAAWAEDRQRHGRRDESDLAALRLIERLNHHFDYRHEFLYRP